MLLMNMLSLFILISDPLSVLHGMFPADYYLIHPSSKGFREDAMRDAINYEMERFQNLLFQVANANAQHTKLKRFVPFSWNVP